MCKKIGVPTYFENETPRSKHWGITSLIVVSEFMIQEKLEPKEIIGYLIRIELNYLTPKIWREVEVPKKLTLPLFHDVIQICMGWEDYHLHQFLKDGKRYGIPDEDFDDDNTISEVGHCLHEFFPKKGSKLIYEYDFGDSWEHTIICKKIIKRADKMEIKPEVLDGERACPPEDCGGVYGYVDLLEALSDPNHEDHDSMIEWLGGKFDPDEFDLKEINLALNEEFG